MPAPSALLKADVRRAALARRRALRADDLARRSAQLAGQVFAHFPLAAWRWLHVFLPLARQHEPDTWPLIRRCWAELPRLRLAVPVVRPDGALRHCALTPATPLHESRWGIPEPDPATTPAVLPAQLDAVLLPLLAADCTGQRVGYGGGYYDRFLAGCRPGTAFIGLNVLDEPPLPPLADVLPTDVPLTAYLTPSGLWHF